MEPSMGASPAELPGLGSSIAASLISLGVVCLLAYFALRWLSRKTGGTGSFGSGPLRILARQNLDPRRSVFVLEAAGRCFLVGAGDNGMNLLAELDRETMRRELEAKRAPKRSIEGRFGAVLARVMARRPKETESAEADTVATPSLPAASGER